MVVGSSRFFKSHALRWTERLGYNQTGALEFTFFLNIPLPATTSTFDGKILVIIKPQIPYPKIGSLRCFFYNTNPAKICTWDTTTQADRTILTIHTPETAPYFQTEIPITITSQTDVGNYGITLPELIQRYKFYFYFYRNGETMFHEVYYGDYVPDPIIMSPEWYTTLVTPIQYGEEAYFRITWINRYLSLGTNYFFELDFDHTNLAWDYNLGWGTSEWYQKYQIPCITENLGANTRCFLTPGRVAGSKSTITVIGLSAMVVNGTFTMHFPKIKFGTAGTAHVTFTLYQNTPGENTLKIPIVTTELYMSPAPVSTAGTNAFNTLSLTAKNQPFINTTLNMAFFTNTANPDHTIYVYPSLFFIATGIANCGGTNKCYVFSDPVRWIVFEPNPVQGTSTSTSLSIQSAPYIGSFPFSARSILNTVVQLKELQSLTVSPGVPTVTITPNSGNIELNINSLALFDIAFTTITHLPANASFAVTFTGVTVPIGNGFY